MVLCTDGIYFDENIVTTQSLQQATTKVRQAAIK